MHTEPTTLATTLVLLPDRRHYELRFQSLFDTGRAYCFECDASGQVNLDALSERAKLNYLYVRSVIGREYATPEVKRRPRLH